MLSMIRLLNPSSRREQIDQFLKSTSAEDKTLRRKTWVVSDLRSKFEIQNLLLEQQGFYEDFDVLRASELWRLLLRRVDPLFRMISSDLVRARVKDQLETMELNLGLSADQAICDFMDQMSPILFHPMGSEKLNEWFAANPESQNRWGSWYKIAERFAGLFIDEKRVAPNWVAPLLLRLMPDQLTSLDNLWERDLVFDLGAELSQVETDLILSLSKHWDVLVLGPWPSFVERFSFLLAPYDLLETSKKPKPPEPSEQKTTVVKAFRFSGMLAEIKHAVATTRIWLEQGVQARNIIIAAPDIEIYWPVLSLFLKEEGIAFNKDISTRLQSLPVIAQWLAILKIKSGQVTPEDLELAAYGEDLPQYQCSARFEDFQALFKQLLDPEDLARLDTISRSFEKTLDPRTAMTLDQFLGQALRFWTRTDLADTLELFLMEILGKTDASLQMKFSTWIFYTERVIAKKEIRLEGGSALGVTVTNILAADSIYAKRRIFLGLAESQLKNRSAQIILPKEILSFNNDFGFYLQYPETSQKSFEIEWLAQVECEEDHFCFPMTHLNGALESPSQFWMNQRIHIQSKESLHTLDLPETTRWDEIQFQSEKEIFSGRFQHLSDVDRGVQGIQEELGLSAPRNLTLHKKPKLSASSFERFRDCAFIFVAEKVFQLKDPPEVDLDLDKRVKGTLAHALLENLLAPPIRWNWSDLELGSILEELRIKVKVPPMEPAIWRGVLSQHITLAKNFLAFEKQWQTDYPANQNLAREKSFEFQFEGFDFAGKIDRIDGIQKAGSLVLLDYKMGSSSVKTFNTWFKENTLQLAFYTWALEKNFISEFGGHKVVAAFYYVLKNFDRTQGFKLKEGPTGLYDLAKRKAQIDESQKVVMFDQLEMELRLVLKKLSDGNLAPTPRDFEICETCHWRRLCRAPHLN